MSAISDAGNWTVRGWVLWVFLGVLAQVALVFWFSDYRIQVPRRVPARTRVHLLPDDAPARPSGDDTASWKDPTLFALASLQGFSGRAWLTIPTFEYELTNPPAPPQWLTPPVEELADDFNEFVQTNLVPGDATQDRLSPDLMQVHLPGRVVAASTVLRVAGPLGDAQLLPGPPLPKAAATILTNTTTVIRVRVDSAGAVLSAALLSSCGIPVTDRDALVFAKSARFARLGSPDSVNGRNAVISGDLHFQWSQMVLEQAPNSESAKTRGLSP